MPHGLTAQGEMKVAWSGGLKQFVLLPVRYDGEETQPLRG